MREDGPIGGFFPLDLPLPQSPRNLLQLWGISDSAHAFFSNGRSALAYLLHEKKILRLWLPAYGCVALNASVVAGVTAHYFPIDDVLAPDCNFLARALSPGDAILMIDYFGRDPGESFRALVAARRDVLWIEDRAQALLPALAPWGDAVIYSPRKVCGVPDGGILVGRTVSFATPEQCFDLHPEFIHPALLRFEDEAERHNQTWYAAYQLRESALSVSTQPMSRIARTILNAIDSSLLCRQRKENYATLMELLPELALFPPEDKSFVPFGFPIRTSQRKKLAGFLHRNGIFAAQHWPALCSTPAAFPAEHNLAAQLLTLPVDQRYDRGDMERIAKLVRQALR
jgi:dTDP-4-amino-4,6-dideoxygalactose transaminase